MTQYEICKEIRERILREWSSEARVLLDRDIRMEEAKGLLLLGDLLEDADFACHIAKEHDAHHHHGKPYPEHHKHHGKDAHAHPAHAEHEHAEPEPMPGNPHPHRHMQTRVAT